MCVHFQQGQEFLVCMRHIVARRKTREANIVAVSKKQKEVYLIFMGWTHETPKLDSGATRYAEPMESWWFPPVDSPILKKYTMTRNVNHAYDWQKAVDDGTFIR
jgi:hypothetical protein